MPKAPLTAATWTKFSKAYDARDKQYKVVQYASRGIAWHLLQADPDSELGARVKNLYAACSLSRKLFRMGNNIVEVDKARTVLADDRMVAWEKAANLGKSAAMTYFWVYDALVFLVKNKVLKGDAAAHTEESGKGWFLGMLCGFIVAVGVYARDRSEEARLLQQLRGQSMPDADREAKSARVEALRAVRGQRLRALVKSLMDLLVTLNMPHMARLLGRKFTDGSIGIFGCVSASLTLYEGWPSA